MKLSRRAPFDWMTQDAMIYALARGFTRAEVLRLYAVRLAELMGNP
jgi:hypothetical protein